MSDKLTGPNPSELSRSNVAELVRLVSKGWEYFWSRDETRGYDKNGKRIGTGIPRKRDENSTFGSRKISFGKLKKSNECAPRRPRRI